MMSRKRIFFFNRFFWPDQSATAQILTDLCRELDGRDYRITVVSSRLDYGNKTIQYQGSERMGGVEIVRLWSTRFGRGSLPGRLLDYLTIYYSFFAYLIRNIGSEDIVVLKTDPPLLSILGAVGRSVRQFRLISWCQDVFPEVAMAELSGSALAECLFKPLRLLRDWSLFRSDRIVVLGEDMRDYLQGRKMDPRRLICISNWSVQSDEKATREQALRREWGIKEDAFVVGYSGNLGRAHDWGTILATAQRFSPEDNVLFLFCGGGHGFDQLQQAVDKEGIDDRFLFLPYQPLPDLASTLRVPDLHWFTLKESMTPFIFPSKFFGILQAGRPVVFIGSRDGEIASLMASNGIGTAYREGDAEGFANTIRRLSADRAACTVAGSAARQLWETRYQKSHEIAKWDAMLQALDGLGD